MLALRLQLQADLFSKIAIISQKHSIDLKCLFNYPLGPLLTFLVETDETLKKHHSQSTKIRKMLNL